MKCSARNPPEVASPATLASFLKGFLESRLCPNEAVWMAPGGRPLCDACAKKRKAAHEQGSTILSIIQEAQTGRVTEYRLRPLDKKEKDEP